VAHFDLPLDQLRTYRSAVEPPDDFAAFWAKTLAETRGYELAPELRRATGPLRQVVVYDVRYSGWAGERIAAWLVLPVHRDGPLPCVVTYAGYGSGRGLPHEHLLFPAAGFAALAVDSRGQGGRTREGVTGDTELPTGPQYHGGFMTRGVSDPHSYYYRRLMSDCVRAVDLATSLPELVDPARIAVAGGSQGGGLSIVVAGLHPAVRAAVPAVPFLCDFPRGMSITDELPYAEVATYLRARRDQVDTVLTTLSYFDGSVFARQATAPALFSVGLMDEICPPSTVFAAYNAYAGPKEIAIFPYNEHEGGGAFHDVRTMQFLQGILDAGPA
jgi:cephalosporin-C deacetylase